MMQNIARRSGLAALALLSLAATDCATNRPSRNGVFNENQYVRKDFLVKPDASGVDQGWFVKATVVQTTEPNPLAPLNVWNGAEGSNYVRFSVSSNQLQMVNMLELAAGNAAQNLKVAETINSWPITNVDLKYRVNLDGERTNFFEENQELDWQQRQWIKINWDKNGPSDFQLLGAATRDAVTACIDVQTTTTTLVPDSFRTEQHSDDPTQDYITFSVRVSAPLAYTNPACVEAFQTLTNQGSNPLQAFLGQGRTNVDLVIKYSMVRGKALDTTSPTAYVPLVIDEKDPIRRKYGTIDYISLFRDENVSGLLGARALTFRFNPKKDIVWYFAPGFPDAQKKTFTDPNGVVDQTNAILAKAGATGKLVVKNFDADLAPNQAPREFGDVRYSFLRWESDLDTNSPFLAVTQFVPDPRTGEVLSASINSAAFSIKDLQTRLEFYLSTIGAVSDTDPATGEWKDPPGTCQDGDTIPLVAATAIANHNGASSLFRKMQEYMFKPVATYGNLGPQDFIVPQDDEFRSAMFAMMPYQIYGDPAQNPFVIPEGGAGTRGPVPMLDAYGKIAAFKKMAGDLDKGFVPYDPGGASGLADTMKYFDRFKAARQDLTAAQYALNFTHGNAQYDTVGIVSFQQVFQRDARHCINGKWETKAQYATNLANSYNALILWHEFGHALGLDHNFMASLDRPNYPHYKDGAGRDHVGMYQSSVMEYNQALDRVFAKNDTGGLGWGPYDKGALGFIYANGVKGSGARGNSVSGQTSPTSPWNDPLGFAADGKTETQFLFCDARHIKYTPFCRQFDFGSTPSEIIANAIDAYEWQYQWRNFRLYRKLWDNSNYAVNAAAFVADLRRFQPVWAFDWSFGEINDTLRRIGVTPPPTAPVAASWYAQLDFKFETDMSAANQLGAAFAKAVIQQSSGERPYITKYDPYYGDVTQQGIIIDKLLALQDWSDIWPVDNFDINQAAGAYLASYSSQFGDSTYQTVAEDAVESMVGGQYDIFPFGKPLAVGLFAKATHSVNYHGRIEIRDWVGGHTFFRWTDFINYWRALAVQYNTNGCKDAIETCQYDPTQRRADPGDESHSDDYNTFVGPDHRRWIWAYIQDRNEWVAVDRDRNTAAFQIMLNYTTDVIHGEGDGTGFNGQDPYTDLLPMKYFLDSFNLYN